MERNVNYFWVGLFVSAALVAIFSFIIWMAGAHDNRNYNKYTVYFTDAVSGLAAGGPVQYKGVQVGKIIAIRLTKNRSDLIKVDIEIAEETPVRAKTMASLAMQGITGRNYIELTTDPNDKLPAQRIAGEKYPVLQGSGTQLSKLFSDMPDISRKILDISTKVDTLLSEQNMQSLSNTLENVERMTRDMNGLLTAQNVQNASLAIANVSTASEDLKNLVARFGQTADKIDTAVNNINSAVTKSQESVNKASQEGLDKLIQLSTESRKMAESIRKLADNLNKDPSQVIYKQKQKGVEIPE